MAVEYHWGRKGAVRNMLFRVRRWVPKSARISAWKKLGDAVFARKGYDKATPLFRNIEIETRTRCNSRCSFCQANILVDQRPDTLMPQEVFDTIVAGLKALDFDGNVKFFVNNEPLLDKRTPEFIRQVKKEVPKAKTEVHTNGLKLNPKNGRELFEAGLDILVINNYSEENSMHNGVKKFLDEVPGEFPGRQVIFYLRKLEQQLMNRGGTAPNAVIVNEPLPLHCTYPFEDLVVTTDGRVTICCQDHYFEAAVGNVMDSSLKDIWYGKAMEELRESLRRSDRNSNKFCQACDFRGFKVEDLENGEKKTLRIYGDLLHE